ncbi:odorant receptor 13a-like [Belonocnema kinseyi]|uniref:odorant receptor 13a-like n=1 Tax=Belonocnema kinseyi TaxID=2817044 RepID=UPI00143DD623|nr:odorant receptor 13a-like [Belonocnema kinseyi]
MCQLCTYILNDKKLRMILDAIKADWNIRTERLELEILKNTAEAGRFYTCVYTANVSSAVATVILTSLTNPVLDTLVPLNESRIRQPVFEAILPFNQTKHFYWTFLYGASAAMYNDIVLSSCESLFAVATLHACGLFSIASYRLKRIAEQLDVREICEDQNLPDSIFEELIHIIESHNHALTFARTLDTVYSTFLFITILMNILLLSTAGLGILTSLGQIDNVIKYGAFTLGVFVHFYCITLPPQKLLDHSVDVACTAYDVLWYKLPIKSRKLLILLIKRSQKPTKLTAGKFYSMDMETFSSLAQTSMSFFTMLFSLR